MIMQGIYVRNYRREFHKHDVYKIMHEAEKILLGTEVTKAENRSQKVRKQAKTEI